MEKTLCGVLLSCWTRCINKSSSVRGRMPNSSSVTDHVCPHDSSKCNNGGAEHCMLHWAELNCTACKKCSFCANNRTAEGASGFCVEHCCYFRSIKLKKLNMSTLEFLVFLHCSYSTNNTASEKQLALHSWHVCKRKKKSRVRQM